MINKAVEINSLTKRYGSVLALDRVTLSVDRGEMFGLIGPDGAGKTTLLRILATLILPDGGTAMVNNSDVATDIRKIRSSVGYMPGRFSLYPDLTVKENLRFYASLFGTPVEENYDNIAPIYERLKPFENRRADRLSGGMKQKLALSCALIHNPEILLLDEPTTGVDATSRTELWDILERLRQRGITIIVSTPYMDEASRCDRIALMNQGRIMTSGTVGALTGMFPCHLYSAKADNMYGLLKTLRGMDGIRGCYPFGSCHHVMTDAGIDVTRYVTMLRHAGFEDIKIQPLQPTIEDLFITLMQ